MLETYGRVESLDESSDYLRVFPSDSESIVSKISKVAVDNHWEISNLYVEQGRLDEVREVTKVKG